MALAVPLRHAPTASTSSSEVASTLLGPTSPMGDGITRTSRPSAIGRPASTPRYRRQRVRMCATLLRDAGGGGAGAAGAPGTAALFISDAMYRLWYGEAR